MTDLLLKPNWPLPPGVHAYVTTREGGFSAGSFASFNLGFHVEDDPEVVKRNHRLLRAALVEATGDANLRMQWIRQVHGTHVHSVNNSESSPIPEADAAYCDTPGVACVVLTADCLPVLFAHDNGQAVAVAHAGWRGLVSGVLENTAAKFSDVAGVSAWLGPAIGPCHFEIGSEVRAAFLNAATPAEIETTQAAFAPGLAADKWMADLYALARIRLARAGVSRVLGSPTCTMCDQQRWYSYRGVARTGRFASLIVFSPVQQEQS